MGMPGVARMSPVFWAAQSRNQGVRQAAFPCQGSTKEGPTLEPPHVVNRITLLAAVEFAAACFSRAPQTEISAI